MIHRTFLTACLLSAIFANGMNAESRTWTDSTGTFTVEAEFRGVKDGSVQLRTTDGRDIKVPLERLSAADRKFVSEKLATRTKPEPASQTPKSEILWSDTFDDEGPPSKYLKEGPSNPDNWLVTDGVLRHREMEKVPTNDRLHLPVKPTGDIVVEYDVIPSGPDIHDASLFLGGISILIGGYENTQCMFKWTNPSFPPGERRREGKSRPFSLPEDRSVHVVVARVRKTFHVTTDGNETLVGTLGWVNPGNPSQIGIEGSFISPALGIDNLLVRRPTAEETERIANLIVLNEAPAGPTEWGYRPAEGFRTQVNPPSFSWRPQEGITSWEVYCEPDSDGHELYRQAGITYNVHCPDRTFPAGEYRWKYRGVDGSGKTTNWSPSRTFIIPEDAALFPLPSREDLLSRIPDSHPRLFVRPEQIPELRRRAQTNLAPQFAELIEKCEELLRNPPPTAEPPKYGDLKRGSKEWKDVWWGNRLTTIRALHPASTLAFTHSLGGDQKYGELARKILMECSEWDPNGSTAFYYNDEAAMPYAYYFARTYTFLHDLLSEQERQRCQQVLKARGAQMHRRLINTQHLWRPYDSHNNRTWHFLGEVGIALHAEVPEAEEWTWYAVNVFANVYPVWSDPQGGEI